MRRSRDVLMYLTGMEDDEAGYLILGIENQSTVHYEMPARNMLNIVTDSKLLIVEEEGGTTNMCKAIDDMRAESREEGLREAVRKLYQSGMSISHIASIMEIKEEKIVKWVAAIG